MSDYDFLTFRSLCVVPVLSITNLPISKRDDPPRELGNLMLSILPFLIVLFFLKRGPIGRGRLRDSQLADSTKEERRLLDSLKEFRVTRLEKLDEGPDSNVLERKR